MKSPVTLLMPLIAAAWLSGCATTPPPASIADTAARTFAGGGNSALARVAAY